MLRFQVWMAYLTVVFVLLWKPEVDGLVFTKTNLALLRPVVAGETVLIDCSTDDKSASLNLLKRYNESSADKILKPDNQLLKQNGQTYTILISSEKDSGIYTCDAFTKNVRIQKTLTVYIAGKVSGAIPEPILSEPTFVISEGRTLKIECRTKGTFAKLSWEKEGVKVSDEKVTDRPFYYVGGLVVAESILTIEDVTLQDSGIYKCVSVSRFDSAKKASADAQVNVKGEKLYWINNNPDTINSITANSGSSIILSCALSHPAKKVKFFRAISGSPLSEIPVNGGKYQLINDQELVIRRVSLLDFGSYVCQVENNLLEEKKIQLFINNLDTKDVSVFVTPSFLQLDFNDNGNITCTTYGGNVDIEWLRSVTVDGRRRLQGVPTEKIYASASFTTAGNYRKQQTMMFKKVTVEDRGSYICKATLNGKPAFREVDIAVREPNAPDIRKFNKQVTKEGVKTALNCRSRGAPNPEIKFFKDGVEIVSNRNGYVINGRKLVIDQPKFPDHNGKYTCKVSNMFGKAARNSSLTVTVAPIIEKTTKIVVVGNKDDLSVVCNIKRSNPIPEVTWEYQPWSCRPSVGYNCKPTSSNWKIADPKEFDIKPATRVTMNSIFKVPMSSSVKKYFIRCTAQHKYGKDQHQVIGIIDKRDATDLLKSSPEKMDADEKEKITLECTGEAGLFVNLSWKKDGTPIVPDGKIIKIEKTGSVLKKHKSVLTVTNAAPKHSGFYECIGTPARLQDDPVVSGSEVKIYKIYSPKIKTVENRTVVTGNKAVVTCTVDSHPVAKVVWYKDGQPLKNIDTIKSEDDCKNRNEGSYFQLVKGKQHKLIVCKSLWKINNGSYSCQATNTLGTVTKESVMFVYANPVMAYEQVDEYVKNDESFSRNCTSEGNPSPYIWWEQEQNGKYTVVSDNTTSGTSYLNISHVKDAHYGNYRCVASNRLGHVYSKMVLKQPIVSFGGYKSDNNMAATASLIAALIAALFIIIILAVLAVILYKRKRLYGGFYILSVPPSPDYFKKLDPTRPLSEQTSKLPYFPEWEYPRNKIRLKNCVGSGAFGEVYIADAVGILSFDPRYKISAKHKPLLSRKRWSFTRTKSDLSRQDSVASTKSNKPLLHNGKDVATVAVKKLKDDATSVEHKDLISELKILIHIGQNENIVNLLAACTKGIERECMVVLEYCPHGSLLSFIKDRRQMFKPIWSKQHLGMEKELTTFDLCVAGYQVAKGLEYLASRKCVHRDVAARNVLVGENYVMKIADFGLARDVYQDERYVKVSGGLLPIKWMAIESIFDRVFTHASDVWSYGVLMWELMTLGSTPYPGIPAKELPEYLSKGDRMDQPGFCPNEVFQIVLETWNELPSHRPTFPDIVLRLARIIEAHCNNPDDVSFYLDKQHVNGGTMTSEENNYLKPVDSDLKSYKFQPPPSYSVTMDRKPMQRTSTRSSERYVSDNRFNDDDASSTSDKQDFDKTLDSFDGSEKSIEPKAKLDEMVSEKDMIAVNENNNERLYENESRLNRKNKEEIKMDMPDEDKDIDEKKALIDSRSSSPNNYINT